MAYSRDMALVKLKNDPDLIAVSVFKLQNFSRQWVTNLATRPETVLMYGDETDVEVSLLFIGCKFLLSL